MVIAQLLYSTDKREWTLVSQAKHSKSSALKCCENTQPPHQAWRPHLLPGAADSSRSLWSYSGGRCRRYLGRHRWDLEEDPAPSLLHTHTHTDTATTHVHTPCTLHFSLFSQKSYSSRTITPTALKGKVFQRISSFASQKCTRHWRWIKTCVEMNIFK